MCKKEDEKKDNKKVNLDEVLPPKKNYPKPDDMSEDKDKK